jgi:hypothetical protein
MLRRSGKYKYKIIQYKKDIPKPKRGEIVVIPTDNRLMHLPPYLPWSQLPSWWKNLSKKKGSIRRCQGTYDYITHGIVIPLWTDVTVRPAIDGKRFELKLSRYGDKGFAVEGFDNESSEGCPFSTLKKIPTAQYPKLVSPWLYITHKGVSLMALPMLHEPNPNYTVVPGVVHTDYYHHIHVVLNITTDKEFTIPAGTPMQYLVPITRRDSFKRIVWGNESYSRFLEASGLGEGSLIAPDRNLFYRKKQKSTDLEILEKENKKWNFFKK